MKFQSHSGLTIDELRSLKHIKLNRPLALKIFADRVIERRPELKFIYGWINPDLNARTEAVAVFTFETECPNIANRTTNFYGMQITPYQNQTITLKKYLFVVMNSLSVSSLEAMAMCETKGLLDEYFEDVFDEPVVFTEEMFRALLRRDEYNLSTKKVLVNIDPVTGEKIRTKNPKYWGNPENADKFIDAIDKHAVLFYQIKAAQQ